MSPLAGQLTIDTWSFPRVSGDEPLIGRALHGNHRFSPRERG